MILPFAIIVLNLKSELHPAKLLFHPRLAPGVLRLVVRVAKIQIAEINRERKQALQHPHRIVPVNREVAEQQKRSQSAAFPEPKRDHALARPLRSDPLDQEAQSENDAAAQPDNLPRSEYEPEEFRFG